MHQIAPNYASSFKIFPGITPRTPILGRGTPPPQTPPPLGAARLDSWPPATRSSPWEFHTPPETNVWIKPWADSSWADTTHITHTRITHWYYRQLTRSRGQRTRAQKYSHTGRRTLKIYLLHSHAFLFLRHLLKITRYSYTTDFSHRAIFSLASVCCFGVICRSL